MHTHTPPCEIQNELLWCKAVRNLPAMWKTKVWSLGWEGPLEKGTVAHSSILAWRIPWTEEPGGLQSMGSQRHGHDWVTNITQEEGICSLKHLPSIAQQGWGLLSYKVSHGQLLPTGPRFLLSLEWWLLTHCPPWAHYRLFQLLLIFRALPLLSISQNPETSPGCLIPTEAGCPLLLSLLVVYILN